MSAFAPGVQCGNTEAESIVWPIEMIFDIQKYGEYGAEYSAYSNENRHAVLRGKNDE